MPSLTGMLRNVRAGRPPTAGETPAVQILLAHNETVSETGYPTLLEAAVEDSGKRLDQFLTAHLPDVSRARVQQVIEEGKVLVNGEQEKPAYKLRPRDRITVLGPARRPPLRAIAEEIPLDVVYEDDDLAVVNKPAGMMVHAGAGATDDERNRGTLVNALLHRFGSLSTSGGELRPGIVHRLDRETSGLIVVAKNDNAHRKLAAQFAGRKVKKKYIALVHGWPQQDSGTVDAAISRDVVRRTRMTTRRSGGREAVSHWTVLQRIDSPYGKFALLQVTIDTGRTHQIRVHMASLGHPVVGDTLYGAPGELRPKQQMSSASTRRLHLAKDGNRTRGTANVAIAPGQDTGTMTLDRNFLHAAAIEFLHPRTGEQLGFNRDIPDRLQAFLAQLTGEIGTLVPENK